MMMLINGKTVNHLKQKILYHDHRMSLKSPKYGNFHIIPCMVFAHRTGRFNVTEQNYLCTVQHIQLLGLNIK